MGVFAETQEGDAAWWQARLAELAPCSLLPELDFASLAAELNEMLPPFNDVAASDRSPPIQPVIFADQPRSATLGDIAAKQKLRIRVMTIEEREQHAQKLIREMEELFGSVGGAGPKMSATERAANNRWLWHEIERLMDCEPAGP